MALPNDRLGEDIIKARHHNTIIHGKSEYPILFHLTVFFTNELCVSKVRFLLEEIIQPNMHPDCFSIRGSGRLQI